MGKSTEEFIKNLPTDKTFKYLLVAFHPLGLII